MTTELAKRDLPTATPQHAKSLSQPELDAHRSRIGVEVKTVLSAYFQPHESEEIKAAQLSWWCDELEDWTHEQVVWALRQWNRDNPRLRPTPGDIVGICKRERGRRMAAAQEKTRDERDENIQPVRRVSRERAAEIMAEAGFKPKRMEVGDD